MVPAESLVGSLCREMVCLRDRWQRLGGQWAICQEESLRGRLLNERRKVWARRLELQRVASEIERAGLLQDRLSQAFLRELTRRPLPV